MFYITQRVLYLFSNLNYQVDFTPDGLPSECYLHLYQIGWTAIHFVIF